MTFKIAQKDQTIYANYMSNIQNLLSNKDLIDVSIVSDGKTLNAHKVILSASSNFFKNIFNVRIFYNL